MQKEISTALITAFEQHYGASWGDAQLRNERIAWRAAWEAARAAPATVVLQREYPAINPKDFDSDSDLWCYIDAWRHSQPGKESGENAGLVCGHIQRLMRAYFDLGRKPATTAPALEAPAATTEEMPWVDSRQPQESVFTWCRRNRDVVYWLIDNHASIRAKLAAAPQAPAAHVDDLAQLVKQLVRTLRKAAPGNDLAEKAMDYLKRQGLQGSPLRATPEASPTHAGLLAAAAHIKAKAQAHAEEFGSYDPDTGAVEMSESNREHFDTLDELAEEICLMADKAAPQAPAAPAVDASDTALLDAMQRHRIALVPEFEGPWDAEIYNDDAEAQHIASGNTPREALRAAIAAQAKEGGA